MSVVGEKVEDQSPLENGIEEKNGPTVVEDTTEDTPNHEEDLQPSATNLNIPQTEEQPQQNLKKKGRRFSIKGLKKVFGIAKTQKQQPDTQQQINEDEPTNAEEEEDENKLKSQKILQSPYYPRRIATTDWDTKPACAVIVTIYSSSSHDELFRTIVQQSPDPESSIALFEMNYATIPAFLEFLRFKGDLSRQREDGDEEAEISGGSWEAIKQVQAAIEQVAPNSVLFNFECCGHCGDHGFGGCDASEESGAGEGGKIVIPFIKALLDAAYMVMVGDFSLKALIHDWDSTLLGPNPFDRVGTCNSGMTIAFDAQQLLACPSGQLQNVGKLNDGVSTAELHCMGGTITCTLKAERDYVPDNEFYTVEVLTIATAIDSGKVSPASPTPAETPAPGWLSFFINCGGASSVLDEPDCVNGHRLLRIGEHKGYLGHCMLKYQSGGLLLASAGHWIELSKLDPSSEERVLTAIREQYGEDYRSQLSQELEGYGSDREKRQEAMRRTAKQLIQSSAPCSYSKRGYY
jgi:hypothetical protein